MKNSIRFTALALAVVMFGCTPEDTGAPPVFNAIDPSLQCPAGKVGWDFTTGGNETDVIPVAVGSEIKVQEVVVYCSGAGYNPNDRAKYVDVTASHRAECDNAVKCVRDIAKPADNVNLSCPVSERSLRVKYKCGNEATLYDASRFNSTTSPYIVRAPTDNANTDKVEYVCGDTISIKGRSSKLPDGSQSVIFNDRLSSCNGKRRCASNLLADLAGNGTGLSRTKYFYTCGNSTAIRSSEAEYQVKRIDFSCGDDVNQSGVERAAALYVKDVSYIPPTYGEGFANPALVIDYKTRLKAACEGKESCEIPIDPAPLNALFGVFKVEYWCGSSQGLPEAKYFSVESDLRGPRGGFRGAEKMSIQCGGRIKIVDATQPWVAKLCPEGVRTCSLPSGDRAAYPDTRLNFFCEGAFGAMQNSTWLYRNEDYDVQARTRTIECPVDNGRQGIELINRNSGGYSDPPPLTDMSACNGKNNCLVPSISSYVLLYRCSGTDETKTSIPAMVNGRAMQYLDCKPKPIVTEVSGCITGYAGTLNCVPNTSGGCDISLIANNTPAVVRACTTDINVKYKCGSNATIITKPVTPGTFSASASPDGGNFGADGGSLFAASVDCPYDPTPRATPSTKACIPTTCPNNTKRSDLMECAVDGTIQVQSSLTTDFGFDNTDWSPTTTVKEGYQYITHLDITHSGPEVTRSQGGTLWAYDVFKKKDGTGPEINGFKCIVGSYARNFGYPGYSILGGWQSYEAALLPYDCFKVAPFGDQNASWYHGSRKANLNEQTFRNTYNIIKTIAVAAFDSKGRAVAANKLAPNPVGFFYVPATGYVDQFDYLAQQSDFTKKKEIVFQRSTQLDLVTASGKLDQSQLEIGATSLKVPPALEFNFKWQLLGDSPFHPMSDQTRVAAAGAMRLNQRNPRATIEIAKEDASLPNKWISSNSALVGSIPLSGGNAQEKVDRLNVLLSADIVTRMLSIRGGATGQRPDGWMGNNIEVNAVFKARVCLDIDGLARPPDATDINNKYVSANVGGVDYKLGITNRCTGEFPFTITRDLFAKPVVVVNQKETPVDSAKTTNQGGERVASGNDQANQGACNKTCTANADCGANSVCQKPTLLDGGMEMIGYCSSASVSCTSTARQGMTSGGAGGFGRSVYDLKSNSSTNKNTGMMSSATATNDVSLMSFNLLSNSMQSVTRAPTEIKISLGRIWASIAAIGGAMADLQKKANPKPVKPWWKPGLSRPFGGKDPQPGIAFGVTAEGFVFAGIVIFQVDISASVSLGFDIVLKFTSDSQTVATMSEPLYPCLKTGTTRCFTKEAVALNYKDASEDCSLKGGRLAEVRTAADLALVKTEAGTDEVWIGAQASHIFLDPTCNDLSALTAANAQARMDVCKTNSVTRYHWVNQSTPFADSLATGTLYNTNLYTTKHGFGALTTIPGLLAAPLKSGVALKVNGTLESHRTTNELSPGGVKIGAEPVKKKYVCEYDPAAKYNYSEITLTPGVEFSAGVGANICWPSNVIGACLSAEFKFITAGLGIEFGTRSLKIFDSATSILPKTTIGSKGIIGKWEVAFLQGELRVELRFFIGSKNHSIAKYEGVAKWEGELFNTTERFKR